MKNIVRKLRRERDETQERLAQAVGTTRQTIINIEKGKQNPKFPLATAIAKHFGLPVEAVFFTQHVNLVQQVCVEQAATLETA